jgi:hypothetical protein
MAFLDLLELRAKLPIGTGLKRLEDDFWEIRKGLRYRILFRWQTSDRVSGISNCRPTSAFHLQGKRIPGGQRLEEFRGRPRELFELLGTDPFLPDEAVAPARDDDDLVARVASRPSWTVSWVLAFVQIK